MSHSPFTLQPHQVPEIPASARWTDQLRWALAVMDHDDPDVGFLASLLAHAHKFGGLSEKQAKYAQRSVDRITALWKSDMLACQQPEAEAVGG